MKRPLSHPLQPGDLHTSQTAHTADLPVPSLVDHHLQTDGFLLLPQKAHLGRADAIAIQNHRLPQRILPLAGIPPDPNPVTLIHLMTGVGQHLAEVPVVGKEEQSLGIHVQPTHRPDPASTAGHQPGCIGPPLLIPKRRHNSPWFVQHNVHQRPGRRQRPAIQGNGLNGGVGLVSQARYPAVHLHPPGKDPLLRLPAGGDPPGR